jgi:hypothetical protein
MWQQIVTRIFAIVLGISGIWFVPVVIIPVFLPGLLVWIGWILIGIGVRRLNHFIFWGIAAAWDSWILLLLLGDTEWTTVNKAFIYWQCRAHAAASVLLCSTAFVLLILQSRNSERGAGESRENQLPNPAP